MLLEEIGNPTPHDPRHCFWCQDLLWAQGIRRALLNVCKNGLGRYNSYCIRTGSNVNFCSMRASMRTLFFLVGLLALPSFVLDGAAQERTNWWPAEVEQALSRA